MRTPSNVRWKSRVAMATSLVAAVLLFIVAPSASGLAQAVAINLTPATETNAVGTDHTVTATVTDGGSPIEGASIHFAVTGDPTPTPAAGNDVTDADGKATFTFSNAAAGTNTITACVEVVVNQTCGAGETSDTATKNWEVPVADAIDLAPPTAANAVGTTHDVTATVTDQFGEPFAGADLRFAVAGGGTPTPVSGDRTSGANGKAVFSFSNNTVATNTVTACVDANHDNSCAGEALTDTATKDWQQRVASAITVTPADAVNHPGENHSVTATVVDQFDDPVSGVSVHINVTGGGNPTPSSLTANTNASGQVQFMFTNPDVAVNTIEACFGAGPTCDTATKRWEEPTADGIELAPAEANNPIGSMHEVTATVVDQFGDPFAGADVHFAVSADGTPTPASGEGTSNASGKATFSFSNSAEAANTITACVDANHDNSCAGETITATATKTWGTPRPTAVELTPASASNKEGTQHFLTGTVTDQFGDPIAGGAVLFSVSSEGTPSPTSGADVSDATGATTFNFTNNTAGVTNTITACLDNGPQNGACDAAEPKDTATKAWSAGKCSGFEGDPRNQIRGTAGPDELIGTPGPDIICGLGGNDVLVGQGKGDILIGGAGADVLRGKGDNDSLRGGKGKDSLYGGPGSDVLKGQGSSDLLVGNDGGDVLNGGGGDDRLKGGKGRDHLNGGGGFDRGIGGPGNDTFSSCEVRKQ